MHTRKTRARTSTKSFSLIELIVVFVIISLLLSMLLPVLQEARDVARRSQCANSLKQVALALTHYHDCHGSFPPGWFCERVDQNMPQWGWEQQFCLTWRSLRSTSS